MINVDKRILAEVGGGLALLVGGVFLGGGLVIYQGQKGKLGFDSEGKLWTERSLKKEIKEEAKKAAEAEEPKTEESKTEESKTEEPKTEEPKAEEPKAEEPKAEEPKAEEIDRIVLLRKEFNIKLDELELRLDNKIDSLSEVFNDTINKMNEKITEALDDRDKAINKNFSEIKTKINEVTKEVTAELSNLIKESMIDTEVKSLNEKVRDQIRKATENSEESKTEEPAPQAKTSGRKQNKK